MLHILRVLTTPSCWIRNERTGKALSQFILDSLKDGHQPVRRSRYTATLNGKTLWVENYPYSYGTIYEDSIKSSFMPSRRAVFALADAMERVDCGL